MANKKNRTSKHAAQDKAKLDTKGLLAKDIATRSNMSRYTSFLELLPDPDIILKKIGKNVSAYNELLVDSHVFSTIQQRKSGVLTLLRDINQGDASDAEYAFIKAVFKKLDIEKLITQILDAPLFGVSILEVMWATDNRNIYPESVEQKPQEWFFFDNDNKLNIRYDYMNESSYTVNKGIPVPENKFLLVQNSPTYMNPYGNKALSRCFYPVTFKKAGMQFWLTFIEKFGNPWVIGKQPRNSNDEDTNDLLNALSNMVQDAVVVVPDDSSVDILEMKSTSSSESFLTFLEFQNTEISKAILTQTLTTEIKNTGSFAASKTHDDKLQSLVNSDKKLVEGALNKLIEWIFKFNFNKPFDFVLPSYRLYEEEQVDLGRSERDKNLVGMVKFTAQYFKKYYNLDDEDFTVPDAAAKTTQPAQFATGVLAPSAKRIEGSRSQGRNIVNDMIDALPDKLMQYQMEKALEPVLQIIKEGSDFAAAEKKLIELMPNLDTGAIQEYMQKLIFIADLAGRI